MMLKNTANSRIVGHDLQRKVLKDAGNSREVDLDLVHLTMMLKNTANSRKVGHDLQRKVLKDASNSRSQSQSSSFDYDAEKCCQLEKSRSRYPKKSPERHHQLKRSRSQSSSSDYDAEKCCQLKKSRSRSPKKSPERRHQLKKSRSRSPKKSLNYHSGPKVSPQVAVNLSQQKSSLKTPDLPNGSTSPSTILNPNMGRQPEISPQVPVNSSQNSSIKTPDLPNGSTSRSTILNPDTGRQTERSPQVPVNSSQNSSLETLASRFTILNPDKERLPEMQLCSSQENSSFNGRNSRSSEIHRNIGSTSP